MGVPKQNQTYNTGEPSEHKPFDAENFKLEPGDVRRMVLIDGSNMIHRLQETGRRVRDIKIRSDKLNAISLLIAVHKLLTAKFEVIVTLKQFFDDPSNVDNYVLIEQLKALEVLHIIPDRKDDDYILLLTAQHYGAVVISNDSFSQNKYYKFDEIKKRAIKFSYDISKVKPREMHLNRNINDLFVEFKMMNFHHAIAKPGDLDYDKICTHYLQYEESHYCEHAFKWCQNLAEFMQFEFCKTHLTLCRQMPTFPYFDTAKQCPVSYHDFKRAFLLYEECYVRP